MIDLKHDIADIKRFREIVGIIFEEGFAFIIENTKLKRFVPIKKKIRRKGTDSTNEVRLRRTLEKLGPTFIKFGQILSIRPDFVPKSYIHELEKLQDEVPSITYSSVKNVVETSTGKKLDDIFKVFYNKPIASASIAQVHKAVLKDGSVVAVKVRRPGIKETIGKDIEIMHFIANLIEKHVNKIAKYDPVRLVEEFSHWTRKELNFKIEAENFRRFYANFENSKTTKIPKIFDEFSNEEVIVMEYLDGIELSKITSNTTKVDVRAALQNGFNSILEQVFVFGLFHGDPHPSNMILLKDNKVGFVDLGIVGRFNEKLKNQAVKLFTGIIDGDSDLVVETFLELGRPGKEVDIVKFRDEIDEAIYLLKDSEIKEVKISKVLEEVLDIAFKYRLQLPREFILFGKAIVTIEGISLMYYPDFKFAAMAKPFIDNIMIKQYSPKSLIKKGIKEFIGLKRVATKIPRQITSVLDKLEQGKIKIEMKDTDIEKLSVNIDKSSNRLTYGMIIAALLISASLLVSVGQSIFYGVSMISMLLFTSALFIGLILIVSILREQI